MTANEMLQLGINVVQLVPEFADQINEVLIPGAGDGFGAGHVEVTGPALKRLAVEAFGGF
jgi:hypothetical protein